MKVLHVSSHFAKYVSTLCAGLPQHVDCKIALSRENYLAEVGEPNETLLAKSLLTNVVLTDFGSLRRPLALWKCFLSLRHLYRSHNPNLVHVQETRSDCLSIWLLLFCWKPIVLTVHDVSPHPGRDRRIAVRIRIYKYMIRKKAAAVIVHGRYLKERYLLVGSRCKGRGQQVVVIPHPALLPDRPNARKTTEYSCPALLFFGRMEPYKGLRVLLSAAQRLHLDGTAFVLRIVGEGPSLHQEMHAIESLPFVEVKRGFASARVLEEEILAADVIVAPYLEASQSGVLSYAIGCGKPIVATSVGSLSEIAIDDMNAVLCKPNDVEALSRALLRVIKDRALRRRLSVGSRILAEGVLSAASIGNATAVIYREVAAPR